MITYLGTLGKEGAQYRPPSQYPDVPVDTETNVESLSQSTCICNFVMITGPATISKSARKSNHEKEVSHVIQKKTPVCHG